MTQEQFMSIVRNALQIIGTAIVTYRLGGLTDATWAPIAGGILMIAPVVWGQFAGSKTGIIKSAAAMGATDVSANGKTITIRDPELAKAAHDAATPSTM